MTDQPASDEGDLCSSQEAPVIIIDQTFGAAASNNNSLNTKPGMNVTSASPGESSSRPNSLDEIVDGIEIVKNEEKVDDYNNRAADHEFFGTGKGAAIVGRSTTNENTEPNNDIIEDLRQSKKSRSPTPGADGEPSHTDLVDSTSGYPVTSDEELPVDPLSNLAANLKKVRRKKTLL